MVAFAILSLVGTPKFRGIPLNLGVSPPNLGVSPLKLGVSPLNLGVTTEKNFRFQGEKKLEKLKNIFLFTILKHFFRTIDLIKSY